MKQPIPWYEKLTHESFRRIILNELQDVLDCTTEQAEEKFSEWEKTNIFQNEECKVSDEFYSLRYYIVNQMDKIRDLHQKEEMKQ